ncbi:MAG: hypothetical protein PHX50_15815 [Massilibacteroides sp.]|nr:hypothetical protein [Massilibacteroides sp.]MDD3064263.1 hypothetical protein [Massilibacteroides sp.]MDD4661231.1 hypothetical protein [Massilibacteroides sp.]
MKNQKETYLKDPSAIFKIEIEKQSFELKKKPQTTIVCPVGKNETGPANA